MNYLRELLYRPKRSDKSLMARFYFADLNLNAVAAELDSFDGRKDPDRCSCLVNKLRSCQDKLLNVCNKMLEEIEPGVAVRSREFRAKFPDDIMTDSLAGQLWFGAECLAAGSSIMNKERESDSMRPLAKAVTKSLEKVRALLREQCLTPAPEYTEAIRENLKIFDRLFAEFEYSYVQCMVHVKSVREYELHQDLIVLFSDTLQRALKNEMVSQDMVDFYEPSLMFAVPRLAIVYGLLISPHGPLNVDKSNSDFPELFLPFKNLLRKIRELLLTLAPHEVLVLEMLLCQHEEPANISTKLKEVERMLEAREKTEVSAQKLQEKLSLDDEAAASGSSRHSKREKSCCSRKKKREESAAVVSRIIDDLITTVVIADGESDGATAQPPPPPPMPLPPPPRTAVVEIDCTEPEIRVSPRRRSSSATHDYAASEVAAASTSCAMAAAAAASSVHPPPTVGGPPYSPRPRQRLKRHNAKRDSRRIPLRYQKDRRAKFKSTDDLLHRLYVCISGAADQLQSNYAGDFRAILKNVFVINISQDDEPEEEEEEEEEEAAEEEEESEVVEGGAAEARRTSQSLPPTPSAATSAATEFPVDLGTDALQQEMSNSLYQDHLRGRASEDGLSASAAGASSSPDAVSSYALNLNLQLAEHTAEYSAATNEEVFYQPEPTLLDIADGDQQQQQPGEGGDGGPVESVGQEPEFVIGAPPRWVPDDEAPACMGCQDVFTLFKRRHHCRNCGLVFCNRCSGHSLPLPQFGMDRPVRVCNRCNLFHQYQEDLLSPSSAAGSAPSSASGRTHPASSRSVPNLAAAASSSLAPAAVAPSTPVSPSATSPSSQRRQGRGQQQQQPTSQQQQQQQPIPPSRANWTRNFGMVS